MCWCECGNVSGVEAQTVTVCVSVSVVMFQVLRHRLSQCVLVLCECGNVPGVEAQTVTVCVGVV